MTPFYAIDSTRVSHREYWWGARSPLVLIGWLTKWLRIRLPSSTDDPNVHSTVPFVVDALPAEISARFGATAMELSALGFGDPVYHLFRDAGTATTIYWATFRHASGEHVARIHQRIWQQAKRVDRGLFVSFITPFADGTFAVSTSAKADLDTPDTIAVLRREKLPATALFPEHLTFVAARRQSAVQLVRSREDAIAATERLHALLRDYHLGRGVFRPRTEAEDATANAVAARLEEANTGGLHNPEVLAEVERIQTARPGWGNAIFILVVSVLAFAAASSTQRDWKFYLWLIPLLFFHEAGHWIAMKIFGYRNLRMFFIPLFGAAVTGRHWNVPGWKKAIVSLAGPVPGIVLGAACTIVGLITGREWLTEAAFLLLIINGFNLLPVLPLDGGHVLHATLFCRNRWLDISFRALAILALLGLSLTGSGKFMMYIAIIMAVGLPMAFKVGKVTDALRRAPIPPPLASHDRIPPSTADQIIDALKTELPAGTNHKMLAQHTVNVFETLNARPPGILPTLGLLTVHGGSFVMAVLCAFLLVLNKHGGGIGNFARNALLQPRHEIACNATDRWIGSEATAAQDRTFIIATAPSHSEARRSFGSLTKRLPATAALVVAGDALLLSLPAADDEAREKWFNDLQRIDTNTFVALTNQTVAASFMCVAPTHTDATNLVREINEYFSVSAFGNMVPPWSSEAAGTSYEHVRRARATWHTIETNFANVWQSPAVTNLNAAIFAARRRGAKAESERLLKQQTEARKVEEARIAERLRAQSIPTDLIDLYAKSLNVSYTNRVERQELNQQIATKLGSTARENDTAASGFATAQGMVVTVRWVGFKDPLAGLPSFVNWLCQQRCRTIKYDIHLSSMRYGDSDDE